MSYAVTASSNKLNAQQLQLGKFAYLYYFYRNFLISFSCYNHMLFLKKIMMITFE